MIEKLPELETWTDIQAECQRPFRNSNRHTQKIRPDMVINKKTNIGVQSNLAVTQSAQIASSCFAK